MRTAVARFTRRAAKALQRTVEHIDARFAPSPLHAKREMQPARPIPLLLF
jgi:hypothetical protein